MTPAAPTSTPNSLKDSKVRTVLDRMHGEAKGDKWRMLAKVPRVLVGLASGKSLMEAVSPALMADIYIPISREQGEFAYLLARTIGASRIVEFGTSFGISTIYLAAAIRDNGGEKVIGSELEPSKHKTAEANLAAAGLGEYADVRLGDAMETLLDVPEPVDMVLIDGWKDLYLPVLEILKPKLRPGAVVLGDNIFTFRKSLRPYVEYMQSGENGFVSRTLSIADGFEFSVYTG